MPYYSYKCGCGERFSAFHTLEDYRAPTRCKCGRIADKEVSAPRIVSDYAGYNCPVTGKWVEGRAAHRENLKRTGSRVLETGEREGLAQRRAADEATFDRMVDETVERQFDAMPSDKKEQLTNELLAGADTTLVRSTPK